MELLFPFLSLLATLTMSLVITRVASVALMATGLSRESARFQARSAFTGVGYTTSEAESIVNHPVRRRIAMILMLMGNVGLAAVAGTVMVSVGQLSSASGEGGVKAVLWAVGILATGGAVLVWLANSAWVERRLNRVISRALRKYTSLNVQDYVALLHLGQGYGISELRVEPGDWLSNRDLAGLALNKEGVLVLGVQRRGGPYLGAPGGATKIKPYDTLLLYADLDRIKELDTRRAGRAGDAEHDEAVRQQTRVEAHEEAVERGA